MSSIAVRPDYGCLLAVARGGTKSMDVRAPIPLGHANPIRARFSKSAWQRWIMLGLPAASGASSPSRPICHKALKEFVVGPDRHQEFSIFLKRFDFECLAVIAALGVPQPVSWRPVGLGCPFHNVLYKYCDLVDMKHSVLAFSEEALGRIPPSKSPKVRMVSRWPQHT